MLYYAATFFDSMSCIKNAIWLLLILHIPSIMRAQSGAEVLKYNTQCTIEDGKLTILKQVVVQINNREGERFTRVSVPFSKKDKVNSIEAALTTTQGAVIRKLKRSDIIEASAISDIALYEDDFVRRFEMKHNTYPYQIHYAYSITYPEFVHIIYWYPGVSGLPAQQASLSFEVPDGYGFNLDERGVGKPEVTRKEKTVLYTWQGSYEQEVHEELYSPSWFELVPYVNIAPQKFTYGLKGNLDTWGSFGKWLHQLNSGLSELPDEDKRSIAALIGDTTDPKEKIRRLYHYLQDHTRYVLVSIDVGGMKPYPAEYVARNKYGDCKALSNYMIASLSYAGIDAYYTVVNAGSQPSPVKKEFPSQQFNHVIVTVPLQNDTVWLECTSNYIPFGYLGTFTQNRHALLINGSESKFVKTPALTPAEVKEKTTVSLKFPENATPEAEIIYTFRGENYDRFSYMLRNRTRSEQERLVRNLIDLPQYELKSWDLTKVNRDADSITLKVHLESSHILKWYGNNFIINPHRLSLPGFETPKKRTQPVRLMYPISKEVSIKFDLPENWAVEAIPAELSQDNEIGAYVFRNTFTDGKVEILRSFTINPGEYELEHYKKLYEFVSEVKSAENSNQVVFKKATQ